MPACRQFPPTLTSVRRNGEKDSPAEGRRFELSVPPGEELALRDNRDRPPAPSDPRKEVTPSREGPRVRISFPPPASLSHQCLPCLPPQRPGFCRECEPGRDQRTGRAGPEPARLGCFSLTGIAAVPPREIKAQQREEPRPWPGHPLLRVALQLARRLR